MLSQTRQTDDGFASHSTRAQTAFMTEAPSFTLSLAPSLTIVPSVESSTPPISPHSSIRGELTRQLNSLAVRKSEQSQAPHSPSLTRPSSALSVASLGFELRRSPSNQSVRLHSRRGSFETESITSDVSSATATRRTAARNTSSHGRQAAPVTITPTVQNTKCTHSNPHPIEIDATKYLGKVSKNAQLPVRPSTFASLFRRFCLQKESQDLFVQTFWFIFCVTFQSESLSIQESMISLLSKKFIRLFLSIQQKDLFLQYYPIVLAHSLTICFVETFPQNRSLFTPAFRKDVLRIIERLQNGCRFTDSLVSSLESFMFPAGIASTSAVSAFQRERVRVASLSPSRINASAANQSAVNTTAGAPDISRILDLSKKSTKTDAKLIDKLMEDEKQRALDHVLDETQDVQNLFLDPKNLKGDYRNASRDANRRPLQVSRLDQRSPLVQSYLYDDDQGSYDETLAAVRDIIAARRAANQTMRKQAQQSELTEEELSLLELRKDARNRELAFQKIHQNYKSKKMEHEAKSQESRLEMQRAFEEVGNQREQVFRSGEDTVSQLTLEIMEKQSLRRINEERSLMSMGYRDQTSNARVRMSNLITSSSPSPVTGIQTRLKGSRQNLPPPPFSSSSSFT